MDWVHLIQCWMGLTRASPVYLLSVWVVSAGFPLQSRVSFVVSFLCSSSPGIVFAAVMCCLCWGGVS